MVIVTRHKERGAEGKKIGVKIEVKNRSKTLTGSRRRAKFQEGGYF